jgi:hypothetical protein
MGPPKAARATSPAAFGFQEPVMAHPIESTAVASIEPARGGLREVSLLA